MTGDDRLQHIETALAALASARDHLKAAGCPQSTDAVRRAMKSTEGARRHARLGPYRAQRQRDRAFGEFPDEDRITAADEFGRGMQP